MRTLTDSQIRDSLLNASRSERKNMSLPPDLDQLAWDDIDFLGWKDPKFPNIGYVVVDLDGEPVGLLLRQTETRARSRPQCSWCADVHLPNDVVFYAAKRAGDAGRRGDTVGTLICEQFECSRNVRRLPPSAYLGFDREAARDRRIEALRQHVQGFVRDIRDGR
ncbi:FBP domain-containing protein [Microbacterium sp. RU33B]|uniref:FBP domain-containing protein n=1 Tax=Microbacterium sp. RU33B TaxID=1907390 RepID=UPI000969414D|nr:FBP domain-containing protein [Microbacterium sp. RU33B]SIT68868.1 FBP C-terminal treble-clef zinc-finger [Microbacterium sp. RU33B]